MNPSQIIELAGIVATQGPLVVTSVPRLSTSALTQYWSVSKCRIDGWCRRLIKFRRDGQELGPRWTHPQWPMIEPVLENILACEMLARVWTAVVVAHDCRRGLGETEPLVRSVLSGQLDARHRLLSLLVDGPHGKKSGVDAVNNFRRRCDRWTDMLLARLMPLHDVSEFAHDPERCRLAAEDLEEERRAGHEAVAWNLTLHSLHAAFFNTWTDAACEHEMNARLASAILGCFPAESFNGTGVFRSLWQARLETATSDLSGMLDELLTEKEETPTSRLQWSKRIE